MAPPWMFTLAGIKMELLNHSQRLRGKGLVQLDEVDLIEG